MSEFPSLAEVLALEEWRPISVAEGYEVSSRGRVRSPFGVVLKQVENSTGYLVVTVGSRKNGTHRSRLVHQLVAEAFHGTKPDASSVIRHLNGNPADNRSENLCWGTASENAYDRVKHGNCQFTNRTHCPRGHAYSEENTYISPPTKRQPNGTRNCRICRSISRAASRERTGKR